MPSDTSLAAKADKLLDGPNYRDPSMAYDDRILEAPSDYAQTLERFERGRQDRVARGSTDFLEGVALTGLVAGPGMGADRKAFASGARQLATEGEGAAALASARMAERNAAKAAVPKPPAQSPPPSAAGGTAISPPRQMVEVAEEATGGLTTPAEVSNVTMTAAGGRPTPLDPVAAAEAQAAMAAEANNLAGTVKTKVAQTPAQMSPEVYAERLAEVDQYAKQASRFVRGSEDERLFNAAARAAVASGYTPAQIATTMGLAGLSGGGMALAGFVGPYMFLRQMGRQSDPDEILRSLAYEGFGHPLEKEDLSKQDLAELSGDRKRLTRLHAVEGILAPDLFYELFWPVGGIQEKPPAKTKGSMSSKD